MIVAALVALTYGTVALVWPERIQKWWLGTRIRRTVAMKVYGKFIESPGYLRHLRYTGVMAVIGSALIFAAAFQLAKSWMR